jgi:hypothetical protein
MDGADSVMDVSTSGVNDGIDVVVIGVVKIGLFCIKMKIENLYDFILLFDYII